MDIILTPDQAIFLTHFELGSHSYEFGVTKRVLTAIPEAQSGYKPDPNSRSALELAHHIAISEEWFLQSILSGSFVWSGEPGPPAGTTFASVAEHYAKVMPQLVEQVKALPPEKLVQQVNFFGMLNNSAATYLDVMNSHTIHHRGQLAAYIRPAGGKVPNIYGGSFDEPMQG